MSRHRAPPRDSRSSTRSSTTRRPGSDRNSARSGTAAALDVAGIPDGAAPQPAREQPATQAPRAAQGGGNPPKHGSPGGRGCQWAVANCAVSVEPASAVVDDSGSTTVEMRSNQPVPTSRWWRVAV